MLQKMWEWRVFLAAAQLLDVDVFSLLNKRNPWSETSRTDIYINVTKDVGVKWRGGGKLEVKLKTDDSANQGSELWSKVHVLYSRLLKALLYMV